MKRLIPLLAAALTLPCTALAANDGTLDTNSVGTLNINLTVTASKNIRISGFTDVALDFNRYEGAPAEDVQNICVYMDQPGTYNLNIVAATLSDTVNDFPYTYTYKDTNDANKVLMQTVSDTDSSGDLQDLTPSQDANCSNGSPATFGLVLAETPSVATAGTAEAIITMTVTPN